MESITSRSNPLCAHLRKLAASAAHRRESGEFLCDSPKLLEEVLLWRRELLRTVLCTDPGKLPELPEGTRVVVVPESLMEYLSPARTPQGVLSLCRKPEEALPETLPGRRYALLDGVQDPGNVGTILRTADAFECDGVFLVNACADLFNPKTARATMGAIFRREAYSVTPEELFALLSKSGVPLYGTALREDTVPLSDANLSKAAVAIGSEGRGLSQQMLDECAKTLKIPMSPRCESLNAAIAATVVLWEMYR